MPEVSVIVPAFNAAQYLEECLDSIVRQTFRNFEVIVIDDGSTDATPSIVSRYQARDDRIKLISTPNGGLSKARNVGIENSKSEFIAFVDADDCLFPNTLEILLSTSISENADIVRGDFVRDKVMRQLPIKKGEIKILDSHSAIKTALYQKLKLNPAWSMLIRRKIVSLVGGFREGILYEDLDVFYRFFEKANKIVYISAPLYFYRKNPVGLTGQWKESRLDVLDVTDRMLKYMEQEHPGLVDAAHDRRFSAHFNMFVLMKRYGIRNMEALERCKKIIREGRKRALKDPEVRFKNKVGALLSYLFL